MKKSGQLLPEGTMDSGNPWGPAKVPKDAMASPCGAELRLQVRPPKNAGIGLGAAQREVKRLTDAGIIRRTVSGNQVFYQANADCPIYGELKGLMVKTSGVADVLRAALAPLAAQIRVAFVYGSVAKLAQRNGSDVDVMVVGEPTFGEVVSTVGNAQETLAREVNPTVYSPTEFRSKLKARHHFLTAVIGGEKLCLIGDEHELARLGAKRLGKPAQEHP